jgi:YidC/Oxa1 family membrane protein insertase
VIEHIIVLDQIEAALKAILTFYHDHGLSWGWAIVLLTVTVRIIILPLTVTQLRSMAAMQRIQPKVKTLQNKYKGKNDRESKAEMQKELMALYKENNVNPFASCLPLLVQFPIFIALYRVLRYQIHPTGDKSFLWINDIFINLNKAGTPTEVAIIVIYIASMLGSTLLFSFIQDKQQKYMFAAMPFFFVLFILRVPIGVCIYWITTNLWTIAQQGVVKQTMGHHFEAIKKERAAAEAAKPRTSRNPKKGGAAEKKPAAPARRKKGR